VKLDGPRGSARIGAFGIMAVAVYCRMLWSSTWQSKY
jgi:hypothetical protein